MDSEPALLAIEIGLDPVIPESRGRVPTRLVLPLAEQRVCHGKFVLPEGTQ